MSYTISMTIPPDMLANVDRRATLKNILGASAYADMQEIAQKAQGVTQYPPAKEGYYVTQDTTVGSLFSVSLRTNAPAFWYTQGYKGLQPPSAPGTKLADWATAHGLPPFPVARRLGFWGALDAGQFKRLAEVEIPRLLEKMTDRVAWFAARWGNTVEVL